MDRCARSTLSQWSLSAVGEEFLVHGVEYSKHIVHVAVSLDARPLPPLSHRKLWLLFVCISGITS